MRSINSCFFKLFQSFFSSEQFLSERLLLRGLSLNFEVLVATAYRVMTFQTIKFSIRLQTGSTSFKRRFSAAAWNTITPFMLYGFSWLVEDDAFEFSYFQQTFLLFHCLGRHLKAKSTEVAISAKLRRPRII